jgi:mRNA interferase RelE/StbE
MAAVRILDSATRELARLDRSVAQRILARMWWLSEHIDDARLEPLTGDLAGLFKLRVGDYRVLYEVLPGERTIVVHQIGHRREVYRQTHE